SKDAGDGGGSGGDEALCVSGKDLNAFTAPGVGSGEHGVSRGGAGGGVGVRVGEANAVCGECIDVWRVDVRGSVAADVAISEIIGEDDDDVGLGAGWGRGCLGEQGAKLESGAGCGKLCEESAAVHRATVPCEVTRDARKGFYRKNMVRIGKIAV